ncbi:GntR family transcriptional regulator [Lacticaseibacillus baoqingensis]|uniref:GntR family transcriptional regulator n=1 Tax=Lacticaseibacillus baoqingensis TaxID=2486013 RepID=A0ABW4E899_9LACO
MAIPKYQQIADEIRDRIRTGVYPPKSLLPDQNTLAKAFGVSRMTIKKALDGLASEGLIYKQSGLGTYVLGDVTAHTNDSPAEVFEGLTKQEGAEHVSSQVLTFDVSLPSQLVRNKLQLAPDEPVYVIDRLRKVDGQPAVLEHTFFPLKLVPGLTHEILLGSIYDYLHQNLHLKFGGALRRINADVAGTLEVDFLNATRGEPVLQVEQVIWLTTGENIEYSTSRNLASWRGYTILDINHD